MSLDCFSRLPCRRVMRDVVGEVGSAKLWEISRFGCKLACKIARILSKSVRNAQNSVHFHPVFTLFARAVVFRGGGVHVPARLAAMHF
jgi:hypothetical protein